MRKGSIGVFILTGALAVVTLLGIIFFPKKLLNNIIKSSVSNKVNQMSQYPSISPQNSRISPTNNWRTYTDKANNYSIMYPSNIFIRFICPDGGLYLIRRQNKEHYENKESVNLSRCDRDAKYAFELKTSKTSMTEPKSDQFYTVTSENIFVGRVKAKKYSAIARREPKPEGPEYPTWYIVVLFENKDISYKVYFDESSEIFNDKEEMKKTFNQILSTFRFITID